MFYHTMSVKHKLIISVRINTIKTKGKIVFAHKWYIRVVGHKHFI
jgi:hypothetical protein